MKWEEAIIDGSSKVQNYLLNAIMVIEKKNSLRNDFFWCWVFPHLFQIMAHNLGLISYEHMLWAIYDDLNVMQIYVPWFIVYEIRSSENGLDELNNCWTEKDCRCLLLKEIISNIGYAYYMLYKKYMICRISYAAYVI